MTHAARVVTLLTLAAIGLWVPTGARAELWTTERSIETRLETTDNYGLTTRPGGEVNTMMLLGSMSGSRKTERSASRLEAGLIGYALDGVAGQNRIDGHGNASQSFSNLKDSLQFDGNFLQDTTFNTTNSAVDLSLGRVRRRTRSLSGAWTRQLDERTTVNAQVSTMFVNYAISSQASNYQNSTVALAGQRQLDEWDSLNVHVGQSVYHTLDDVTRSVTTDLSLGVSGQLSETDGVSLSLGAYRTATTSSQLGVACPLQLAYCKLGLVSFVLVRVPNRSDGAGLEFNASYSKQVDEVTGWVISASRQQSPSGTGAVVRNDFASAALNTAWSPTLNGSFTVTRSRTAVPSEPHAARPSLLTVKLLASKACSSELTINASVQYSRETEPTSGFSAHASTVNVSLKYEWPRIEASR